MLIHPTLENLKNLKLFGMVRALELQLNTPDLQTMSFEERLGLLVDQEMNVRDNSRLAARLRHAKLRQLACIEDLDLTQSRGLDKMLVASLADSQWIKQHRNILITGSTGAGKTYLACALAQKSCRDGFSAVYHRMSRVFEDLVVAKASGSYPRYLHSLLKRDLLVLDDFALVPLSQEQRRDLLEILEDRYERKSTLVVSQLPVEKWYESIGDATFADAILDRLVHNAYKICLTGESMRKKKNKKENIEMTSPAPVSSH
jgi:DNA replication protein DnaC